MKIKLLIKFTKEEIKLYKEIKNAYPQKDFKNDDKVSLNTLRFQKNFKQEKSINDIG